MIYDMTDFQWKEQINHSTDMAYWIDDGNKAITISVDGDLVCWETI